jgi:hypothetical protein
MGSSAVGGPVLGQGDVLMDGKQESDIHKDLSSIQSQLGTGDNITLKEALAQSLGMVAALRSRLVGEVRYRMELEHHVAELLDQASPADEDDYAGVASPRGRMMTAGMGSGMSNEAARSKSSGAGSSPQRQTRGKSWMPGSSGWSSAKRKEPAGEQSRKGTVQGSFGFR